MLSGAIILNEQAEYEWYQLLILLSCSILCIFGVFIIVQRPKDTQGDNDAIKEINDYI